MPNHLHGIIVLTDHPRRGGSRTAPTDVATQHIVPDDTVFDMRSLAMPIDRVTFALYRDAFDL